MKLRNLFKRLYTKLMGAPENIQTNSNKVAYTDYWPIDKVIFSDTSTFTVTNSVSTTPQFFTLTTPIGNNYARPVGIFSTDGGTTWNDMGNTPATSSLTNNITLPAVSVEPDVSGTGTTKYRVVVSQTVGSGGTFSLICSLALLAVDSPGTLTAIPTVASGTTKSAFTTLTASGGVTYRQIIAAYMYNTTIGTSITAVAHGLGYIPDTMVWLNSDQRTPNANYIQGLQADVNTSGAIQVLGNPLVYMDATNIYYSQWGAAAQYLIRLYRP